MDDKRYHEALERFASKVRVIAYRGDCDSCNVPDELMELLDELERDSKVSE